MKRVLKIIIGRGLILGLALAAISLAIDYLKFPPIARELIFFFCGFFYCAYIIDKD